MGIRKDTSQTNKFTLKRGDLFGIIIIQMKGGSAKLHTAEEIGRLKTVAKYFQTNKVTLFEWRKRKKTQFYILNNKMEWKEKTALELFGT